MSDETLDRKRSYGLVYGHPGIGFIQDNKPFRHDGTPYSEPILSNSQNPAQGEPLPTAERALTHSEKMKQAWAARRANDANTQP